MSGYFTYLIDYYIAAYILGPLQFNMWFPFNILSLEVWWALFTLDTSNWYNSLIIAGIINMFWPYGVSEAALRLFHVPLERGFKMG